MATIQITEAQLFTIQLPADLLFDLDTDYAIGELSAYNVSITWSLKTTLVIPEFATENFIPQQMFIKESISLSDTAMLISCLSENVPAFAYCIAGTLV